MKKQAGQKEIIKKVLEYIRPQWFRVLLSLLMAVISVALTLYLPVLTGRVVDHILGPGKVEFTEIFAILRTMLIAILLTAAAQWIMNIANNRIVYTVTRSIREEAFQKIEILPLKYLDGHSTGEIVSRIIADVDQFKHPARACNRILQLCDNTGNFIKWLRILIRIRQKCRELSDSHHTAYCRKRSGQADSCIDKAVDKPGRRIGD